MDLNGIHYKPRILNQGLMLVLIPFFVICLVLFLLTRLCITQEKLCASEQHKSQILSRCVLAFNDWGETSAYMLGRAFSDDKSYESGAIALTEKLKKEFAEINKPMTAASPPEEIQKVEALCMDAIEELASLPRASGDGALANFESLQRMPMIFNRLYSLPNQVKLLLEGEKKSLQVAREKQDQQALQLRVVAWACFIANIILCIVLIWYFSKGITSRLQIVTANANLLPKLEKLNLKIGGNDELAYLAAVMQSASDKLIEAAEHRRAIFGMVAHDMRSPINAGQLCLEVVEEAFTDEPIENSNHDLKQAHSKMVGILKHVNELLSVESKEQSKEPNPSAELTLTEQQSTEKKQEIEKLQFNSAVSIPLWQRPLRFMHEMVVSPRIFHKALWLVLIPLVFQSVFLLFLNQQIKTNNKLIVQERRQSDLILGINIIFLDSLKATVAEAIYIITNEERIRIMAMKNFDIAIEEFPLKEHFAHGKNDEWEVILKSWRKMLRLHKDQTDLLDSLVKASRTTSLRAQVREMKPLQKKATKLRSIATKQFKKDSIVIEGLQEQQLQSRKDMTEMLGFALVANFIIAFLMLYTFNRDISGRLKRVVDNATNLGTPGTTTALLPGKDEFAYLDLILQHTKQQLENAAGERAEMMRVIANEMQLPLIEARASIEEFTKKEDSRLTDRMKKQISRAQHNINRVLFLINDLLTMETLETGKVGLELAQCSIHSFIDEAIATVSSLAKHKDIEISNDCDDLEIQADKARLIQTAINYLSNAIKFSPSKSKIVVNNSITEGRVRINVIDQGPGMDEVTKSKVFERFFQAEGAEKKQGFGLGLAICTLIIQSHGGKLGVESEPGKGSNFWFEVPINPAR